MSSKKKSFWPYGIALAIFAVFMACVATVIIAVNNPVEMDDFYLQKYQNVDKNFINIEKDIIEFNKKFKVKLDKDRVNMGKDFVSIIVTTIDNTPVKNAEIEFLITRPDVSKYDKKGKIITDSNGVAKIEEFDFEKIGRWQILVKTAVGEYKGYNKMEVFAR
jgi:hypothetical protein